MDDESLLRTSVRVTAAPNEYQPEVLAAVRDEVARRHLTPAQQRHAEGRAKQEALDSLQDDAVRLALQGRDLSTIEAHLKAGGLADVTAADMAKQAWDMPIEQRRRAGRRNMMSGVTLCLVGVLITAGTNYMAATTPGGGRYAIAWGLVLVGLLQFFRGVDQITR
jgi:hypothetical protein